MSACPVNEAGPLQARPSQQLATRRRPETPITRCTCTARVATRRRRVLRGRTSGSSLALSQNTDVTAQAMPTSTHASMLYTLTVC